IGSDPHGAELERPGDRDLDGSTTGDTFDLGISDLLLRFGHPLLHVTGLFKQRSEIEALACTEQVPKAPGGIRGGVTVMFVLEAVGAVGLIIVLLGHIVSGCHGHSSTNSAPGNASVR